MSERRSRSGGMRDRDHVQAVEEVLAEAARRDLGGEVLVRGRDHAHVDLHDPIAADGPHLAILQHAQELHLERRAHLGDLVEEDGAAVRELEQAGARPGGAGEGAALVAEHLGLEQLARDGAAVDRHERRGRRARCARAPRARPAPCRCRSRRGSGPWRRWRPPCGRPAAICCMSGCSPMSAGVSSGALIVWSLAAVVHVRSHPRRAQRLRGYVAGARSACYARPAWSVRFIRYIGRFGRMLERRGHGGLTDGVRRSCGPSGWCPDFCRTPRARC